MCQSKHSVESSVYSSFQKRAICCIFVASRFSSLCKNKRPIENKIARTKEPLNVLNKKKRQRKNGRKNASKAQMQKALNVIHVCITLS